MTGICAECEDPLTLMVDPSESGDEGDDNIPDDLRLRCGCHFHWQCLMDHAPKVADTLSCPFCKSYVATSHAAASSLTAASSTTPAPTPEILTHYTNEGGAQPDLDIYPTLVEESFLAAHPEARAARALHALAASGDVYALVELLRDVDGDRDVPLSATQLLIWRDPINGLRSALHVALEACQEEVMWVLLWLGSAAKREDFPEAVAQVARAQGLPRREGPFNAGEDVRSVRDEMGRTAGDLCSELGPPWSRLVEGGLFS